MAGRATLWIVAAMLAFMAIYAVSGGFRWLF